MPRPRFNKLTAEKRESILEAAAKEFATHGFEGASLNQILSNAGISKGAAYYYFDDKAPYQIFVLFRNNLHFVLNFFENLEFLAIFLEISLQIQVFSLQASQFQSNFLVFLP